MSLSHPLPALSFPSPLPPQSPCKQWSPTTPSSTLPDILTQLEETGHSDLYENAPRKEEKRGVIQAFNPQNDGPYLGSVSPGNTPLSLSPPPLFPEYNISSQDTSSTPSPAWLSEPILSLSHLSVNLRINNVYCIYNIYMVLMVLSHTLPTCIALKMHPLHCAIHRKSSQTLWSGWTMDGRWDFPSLPLWKDDQQIELSSHCLLSSVVLIPTVDLLLDENL